MFCFLPKEVIARIISLLDDKDLLSINTISNQFKTVYDEYLVEFLKNILRNKGICATNDLTKKRLMDVYKFRNCNTSTCCEFVLGNNGVVYFLYTNADNSIEFVPYRANLISIDGLLFIKDNGYVVQPNSGKILNFNNVPLCDVIQILWCYSDYYCLTSNGKVYCGNGLTNVKNIQHLNDIIKITETESRVLFLQRSGDVFENSQKIIKPFSNVADIISKYLVIILINKNGSCDIYRESLYRHEPYKLHLLYTTNKKIIKAKIINNDNVWILDSEGVLLNCLFKPSKFDEYTNIKDFSVVDNYNILSLDYDNNLILRDNNKKILKTFDVCGNVHLMGERLICINGIIYYIDHDYNLLKVGH